MRSRWVYPRACGGTTANRTGQPFEEGLSPRLRGNAADPSGNRRFMASIPALAGERTAMTADFNAAWVYPRACGGTRRSPKFIRSRTGLSPRLRGNDRSKTVSYRQPGSIPALAGERLAPPFRPESIRVYPRACGGTFCTHRRWASGRGLSPRLRGNVFCDLPLTIDKRSIPALAGERATTP